MNPPLQSIINQAIQAFQAGNIDAAERYLLMILQSDPKNPMANHILGLVRSSQEQHGLAEDCFKKALKAQSHFPEAWFGLGATYQALKYFSKAADAYQHAVQMKPDYWMAWSNLGVVLKELERYAEAVGHYEKALNLNPNIAEVWSNRAVVLRKLGRYEEAFTSLSRAVEISPNYSEAWFNAGLTWQELKQYEQALGAYHKVLENRPNYSEAWLYVGLCLYELKQYEQALQAYRNALEGKPQYPEAWFNLGIVYTELKNYDQAFSSYSKAKEGNNRIDYLQGNWYAVKMSLCDWKDELDATNALIQDLQQALSSVPPFTALAAIPDEALHLQAARTWASDKYIVQEPLGILSKSLHHPKIRVGYFSADFRSHPVAALIAGVLERHNHERFETIAFSYAPNTQDEVRKRLELAFDQFIDVTDRSDREIAKLARELEIDIAVDLTGYTRFSRVGIFAHRAAPIQVNFLGYPGTLGAPYMDYIIADHTLIPAEATQYYSEKIVYMPHCYQPNDRLRPIAPEEFTRSQFGLPEQGVVYCCFNNNFKITPQIYDVWMRILSAVPGSVLWLFEDNPTAAINLKQEAQQREVDPKRIFFAQKMPLAQHLARYRLVDLFLDTLPYNAHTTASDALWVGTPVLTCLGQSFAGRVAASLLKAAQLPELITENLEQYEALAIELGSHPEQLKTLKDKLMTGRLTCPLFDTALFTKHLEQAYQQMYERYLADLVPANMEVG